MIELKKYQAEILFIFIYLRISTIAFLFNRTNITHQNFITIFVINLRISLTISIKYSDIITIPVYCSIVYD